MEEALSFDELLAEFQEETEEKLKMDLQEAFMAIRRQINALTRFDVRWLYKGLFKHLWLQKKVNNGEVICHKALADYTVRHMDSGYLFYEDALAIAWLQGALEGTMNTNDIKHVVIDEAQDYSRLHYEIFYQIFPGAEFTLLGDVNQSVNPYLKMGNYVNITDVFDTKTVASVTLQRSYRSSKQIAAFCSALLLHEDKTIYLDREGSEANVEDCVDEAQLIVAIKKKIAQHCGQGHQSVAVICKTEKSAVAMHKKLAEDIELGLITRTDIHYKQGVVVVPSYLAKGLEFDAVIVCADGYNNYTDESERNLFYTVCLISRAFDIL